MLHGRIILFDKFKFCVYITFILCITHSANYAQEPDYESIKKMVQDYKRDERGPYQAIRWFCPDGSILPPKERCPELGGIQHALVKDVVQQLAADHKIYLGQILAASDFEQIFDAENLNLRLQQYQMEKYLQAADNGWIMRRARYYRGAVQAEDEANWGKAFLEWLVTRDDIVNEQYFLLRQVIRDIPHMAKADKWGQIRGLSKTISDSIPSFMDLRVKLHGQPEIQDLQQVEAYYIKNKQKIPSHLLALYEQMMNELQAVYGESDISELGVYINKLPSASPVTRNLKNLLKAYQADSVNAAVSADNALSRVKDLGNLLLLIREQVTQVKLPRQRLAMLDLSNELENILFRQSAAWQVKSTGELLNKNHILSLSLAGCGLLELWEWRQIEPLINPANKDTLIPFAQFVRTVDYARRVVEWGSGMVRTVYDPVIHLFDKFEPLASGFFDDRIRSSLLLAQGEVASRLSEILASQVGMTHQVMGVKNQGEIRGINPGYASGELVVISGDPEKIVFSAQKIYLVRRAPADMKPVAGIATVSEGNLVSHVQLLARNLGIPNAVISEQNLNDLLPYAGKKVFYAVSPAGTVVLKTEAEMSPQEKALVEERKRSEERINVPTAKLNLNVETLVDLKNVRATDSGSLCGPKAANLGELKHLFPDKVVDGVVIPFGIFRRHLDQTMPGTASSYWLFLHNIFDNTSKMRDDGKTEGEIEKYALGKLAELSKAIRSMPFLDGFEENLADQFSAIFSEEIGEIPVFIRSDTNMEDLKDFTGAGLNLTVFNVREGDKIFQAIRDVWASPYAERSYRWRQKYLLNPENVFPSVLIIPTVPVEKSGVLITTGITSGQSEDLTVAFNRGAAGAVEGQMAESYLLRQNGKDRLISPSRERWYTTLPQTGGILKKFTHFNKKILNSDDLKQIRAFARELQTKIADISKGQVHGPYDVELGFMDNDIWLFQVRPYVESKKARSSEYLRSLDQVQINPAHIRLNDKL